MGPGVSESRHDRPLTGAVDVATAALQGGLRTIEGVHTAIAGTSFAPLRTTPGIGEVSDLVRVVHDGVTSLVYATIRTAIGAGGHAARLAARFAASSDDDPQPE